MAFPHFLQMSRTIFLMNTQLPWSQLRTSQMVLQVLVKQKCCSSSWDDILGHTICKNVYVKRGIAEKADKTASSHQTDESSQQTKGKLSNDFSSKAKSVDGGKDKVVESSESDPSEGQIKCNVEVRSGSGQKGTENVDLPKKKRKAQLSETMKVIRDKKMLERFQLTSNRKRKNSSKPTLPFIVTEGSYREQLLDYISRHDETWETYENDYQFAVSKSGKVLIFPMKYFDDVFGQNLRTNSEDESVPSVTSILSATKPMKQVLNLLRWEKRMTAELGEDGFREMKQEMFREGHQVHRNIENYLMGASEDALEIPAGYWESCSDVLPRVGRATTNFEIKVKHPVLSYLGYIDCLAEFDGKMSLIEWKTSRKHKPNLKWTEDYALQAVAYLGALNFDPQHNVQVEQIVIVVVYKDGLCATVHILDEDKCNFYWNKWLGRLLEYREIAEMKKDFVKRQKKCKKFKTSS